MKKNKCLRCGHEWFQRTEDKPRVCPGCHSVYWDKARKVKEEKKEQL